MSEKSGDITRLRGLTALVLTAAFLTARPAVGEQLTDDEVTERLEYIEKALIEGKFTANLWWGGWLGFNAGTMLIFGIKAGIDTTKADMQNDAVSAAQSALGVLGLAISPMVPGYASDRLRELPDSTAEQRREKLARAEELLRESAEYEIFGWSWVPHVLGVAVGLAGGLTLWLGFKRPIEEGLINFGLAVAVNEAQIWTQPMRAKRDWEAYQLEFGASSQETTSESAGARWFVAPAPGGFAAGVSF